MNERASSEDGTLGVKYSDRRQKERQQVTAKGCNRGHKSAHNRRSHAVLVVESGQELGYIDETHDYPCRFVRRTCSRTQPRQKSDRSLLQARSGLTPQAKFALCIQPPISIAKSHSLITTPKPRSDASLRGYTPIMNIEVAW